jgi:hypothetical protein
METFMELFAAAIAFLWSSIVVIALLKKGD